MLYKIDYTELLHGNPKPGTKWVNFVEDQTEAVKKFMNWFFVKHPNQMVRLEGVTGIEVIGDMTGIELIDDLAE